MDGNFSVCLCVVCGLRREDQLVWRREWRRERRRERRVEERGCVRRGMEAREERGQGWRRENVRCARTRMEHSGCVISEDW
eukprot:840657-Rhodomonas_salina.1